MFRRSRPGARTLAIAIAVFACAAGIAVFVMALVKGADDADKYGRISLPGKGQVELPEGKVALYYEERVKLSDNESLDTPKGLTVVARRENTVVKSKKTITNGIETDSRALNEFGKLEIPRAGLYRVRARSKESGFNRPAVTFGKGQLGAWGRGAGLGGAIAAAGLLLGWLILLIGRRGYDPPGPSFAVPPGAPATGPAGGPPTGPVTGPAMPIGSGGGWGSASQPSPSSTPPSGDPLEAQLRELKRQHEAGALSDSDYAARRKQALDNEFGR